MVSFEISMEMCKCSERRIYRKFTALLHHKPAYTFVRTPQAQNSIFHIFHMCMHWQMGVMFGNVNGIDYMYASISGQHAIK